MQEYTPKIVESVNFAPLRYSTNSCLLRHKAVSRFIVKMNMKSAVSKFKSAVSDFFKFSADQVSSQ